MKKLALALLASLALLTGSAVLSADPATEAGSNIVWKDCFDGLDCGTIRVPMDYKRPSEEQIEIALVRVPALDQENRVGSLLMNFGGPGGPGFEIVVNNAAFFPFELRERFDIIGFDPRGVGMSSDVDCVDSFRDFPLTDSTPDPRSYAEQVEFWQDFARDCQRRTGKLLQFVDTNSAARDMDRIREELGDEQLNYIGFSYGSLLGQAYADIFPERVRALVIDGIIDPANTTHDMILETTEGADIALNGFFDACRAAPSCAFKAPDLGAAFDTVVAQAQKTPLPGWVYPVTADLILQSTFGAMYDHTTWPLLAEALRQAYEQGSGVGFGVLISGIASDDDEDLDLTNGFEAFASIACVDFLVVDGEREFQRILDEASAASPRWGAYMSFAYALPCAFWPGAPRRPAAPVVAEGSAPILVVSSKYDPITRYDFGVAVANQLANARLLSVENYGHTSHGACSGAYISRYLIELALPPEGTVCPLTDEPFPVIEPELEEPTPGVPPPPPPPVAPQPPAPPTGPISPPNTGTGSAYPSSGVPATALIALALAAAALTVTRGLLGRRVR